MLVANRIVAASSTLDASVNQPLHLLIVEDSVEDVELILRALRRGGYDPVHQVVDDDLTMREALNTRDWDAIISDNNMPRFSAEKSLALAMELRPHVPFIIVSGDLDLDLAIAMIEAGARDYVQKQELARLALTLGRELKDVRKVREEQWAQAALQASETRYRRLFETAQDGILILDANTKAITDVNPFLMDLLGYAHDAFVGKKLWELGPFQDIEESKLQFAELQNKGYIRYEDLPLETFDGRHIAVEFVSNVYLVDDKPVIQCNIRDITARKNAEGKLRELNVELEQRVLDRTVLLAALNKELEAFNYSVAHDLRAPLRRINSLAEALREDSAGHLSEPCVHHIDGIQRAGRRMNGLIDALLSLSQLARNEIRRRPVNLSGLAHAIVAQLRNAEPARNVDIVIADGVVAQADAGLVRIVMENLLNNAWKFTGHREAASIKFGAMPEIDGSTTYFVRDNGTGFDMAYANKLFNPFQRLHGEKEFPGNGIGLATVGRIIQRHGGRVWLEGVVDKGATCHFTLPVQAPSAA